MFGSRVGGLVDVPLKANHAGDIYDITTALWYHELHGLLAAQERPSQIHPDQVIKVSHRKLCYRAKTAYTGVVNQNVQPPPVIANVGEQRANVIFTG